MSKTLSELKAECRQRSDMTNSEFVTDAELTGYINNSIAELHDLLIQAYDGDYYIESDTFTTSGNAERYALSSIITNNDFYKLRGIDAKLNNTDWCTLSAFSFNERNKNKDYSVSFGPQFLQYRLVGENLTFTPAPVDNTEIKVWYIPVAQTLINDTDNYNDLNHYSEYVIVDAAIKMLQKEESDVSVLMNQKAALKRRIEEAANNRDAGDGESISDIYKESRLDDYGYII